MRAVLFIALIVGLYNGLCAVFGLQIPGEWLFILNPLCIHW